MLDISIIRSKINPYLVITYQSVHGSLPVILNLPASLEELKEAIILYENKHKKEKPPF